MKIVTDERVPKFVGERVGTIIYPPFTSMGIDRDGEIVAGAIFNCFTGTSCQVTVAGTGWTRGYMVAVGRYVFDRLNCLRMTVTTEQPAIAGIALRLGGKVEGTLRNEFGQGRHGTVIGILREEYRFMKTD